MRVGRITHSYYSGSGSIVRLEPSQMEISPEFPRISPLFCMCASKKQTGNEWKLIPRLRCSFGATRRYVKEDGYFFIIACVHALKKEGVYISNFSKDQLIILRRPILFLDVKNDLTGRPFLVS